MHKSTVILAMVSLVLAAATGSAVAWLQAGSTTGTVPAVEGAILQVGLGDLRGKTEKNLVVSPSAVLWESGASILHFEQDGFERRSIASLTKLMTAMVAIEYGVDWEKEVGITPEEERIGGRLALAPDERVTMRDLLHASLMGSANNATLAFVHAVDVPEEEFVRAMNRKAIEMGLEQTEFVDVTGLDPDNVSTAYEVARMAEMAWREYPAIGEISSKARYEYTIAGSGREHTIVNTNNMIVDEGYDLGGSKTGYLNESLFCLAVQGSGSKTDFVAVVLGAPSEWDSMEDIRTLLDAY